MLDNETIVLHVTRIDGKSYRNDYTVMWRGLPIGRIRRNPGLPAHIDQWSWGCNVYGQPSLSGDSGQDKNLEDCKDKFRIAWLRIRARLTDATSLRRKNAVRVTARKTPFIAATTHRPNRRLETRTRPARSRQYLADLR